MSCRLVALSIVYLDLASAGFCLGRERPVSAQCGCSVTCRGWPTGINTHSACAFGAFLLSNLCESTHGAPHGAE